MSERRRFDRVKEAADQRNTRNEMSRLMERTLVGAALLLAMLLVGVQFAKSALVLPS